MAGAEGGSRRCSKDRILEIYLNEIYPRPTRLRFCGGGADVLRQAAGQALASPRRRCWPACRRTRATPTRCPTSSARRHSASASCSRACARRAMPSTDAPAWPPRVPRSSCHPPDRHAQAVHAAHVAEMASAARWCSALAPMRTRPASASSPRCARPTSEAAHGRRCSRGVLAYDRRGAWRGPEGHGIPARRATAPNWSAPPREALKDHKRRRRPCAWASCWRRQPQGTCSVLLSGGERVVTLQGEGLRWAQPALDGQGQGAFEDRAWVAMRACGGAAGKAKGKVETWAVAQWPEARGGAGGDGYPQRPRARAGGRLRFLAASRSTMSPRAGGSRAPSFKPLLYTPRRWNRA